MRDYRYGDGENILRQHRDEDIVPCVIPFVFSGPSHLSVGTGEKKYEVYAPQ